MTGKKSFSESDLHAYLDGELTGRERDEFQALIERDPDLRKRVEGFRDADEMLRQALDPVANEGVPARLLAALLAEQRTPGPWLRRAAVAAIAAFVLGGWIGWYGSGLADGTGAGSRDTARQAQNAHRVFVSEVRHPVEVVAADYDHLVGWLSKRLGHALVAPDFSTQKFELIGGRLLPGAGTAAAQFMYEDKAGERITFYVAQNPGASSTAFRLSELNGLRTFYWIDGPFGYALSGNIDQEALLALAHAAYDQLSPLSEQSGDANGT